jgi:hypothetical protein
LLQQRYLRQRAGAAADHRDIKGAEAILRDAGWTLRAPNSTANDAL